MITAKQDLELSADCRLIFRGDSVPLQRAFSRSQAEGVLETVFTPVPDPAGPLFLFFRNTVRNLLQGFLRETDPVLPSVAESAKILETMPSIDRGAVPSPEYLASLFAEIVSSAKAQAEKEGKSLRDWILFRAPDWKNIGRVTFHLAENKKDPDGRHPFVFLATYPDRTGESGEVRHVPLASALKLYAKEPKTLLNLLTPVRNAAAKSPFLNGMMTDQSLFRPCLWTPHQAFLFVREIETFRSAGLSVRLNREPGKRPAKLKLCLTLDPAPRQKGVPVTESILRFSVEAAAGDRILTKEELDAIMRSGGGLIRVKGEWIEADTENVRELLRRWEMAKAVSETADVPFLIGLRMLSGIRGKSKQTADGLPPLPEDLCEVRASPELESLLTGRTNDSPMPEIPAELPLRPYQRAGVEWLYRMGELGLGGCLADDMGLGKTLQVLTCLELLRRQGVLSPVPALAVVPASLLGNWSRESEKFTPLLHTAVLHPSEETVAAFREDPAVWLRKQNLVVTSYGMAVRLLDLLKEFTFPVILLDEAQNIKNASCVQSSAVRQLHGLRRFALTGTPVENSVADLWSIFDFLTPGLLGTSAVFQDMIRTQGQNGYAALRRLVRPCILRRLKTDKRIIRDLPDKSEIREWCFLTKVQLQIYQRAVNEMKKELELAEEERRSGVILSFLMQFKQICNHPTQFTGLGEYSIERSGKFRRLAELAEQFARRGDRVLVFTQFREIMEPIRAMLAGIFGRDGLMLHGGISPEKRTEAVAAFQREDGPPFFVLSLRAAGTGLNLTAANHVVHFDRWWNPAVENQATDRAYRIGQHRNVLVHKFICKGTLEEKIDAMLAGKTRMAGEILSGSAEKMLTDMSNAELLECVRAGFMGDDGENGPV